jgi:transcriptional regulator with XRE-family HTH domain
MLKYVVKNNVEIGTNIKVIRTSKKIRQKELAKELGITQNYLSMIENNMKKPSLSLLEKLSSILNSPLSLLFSDRPLAVG